MLKEKFYEKFCFRSRITIRLGISAGVVLSLIFSLIVFPSVRGLAAAGDLDPTFGIGGKVTTDVMAAHNVANDLAIQPDGKIVVARLSPFGFSTSRHNLDGSSDSSFGSDGVVITQFTTTFEGSDLACCAAIQTDGKIIVAGKTDPAVLGSNADFALARYLED